MSSVIGSVIGLVIGSVIGSIIGLVIGSVMRATAASRGFPSAAAYRFRGVSAVGAFRGGGSEIRRQWRYGTDPGVLLAGIGRECLRGVGLAGVIAESHF
jgi:hypothetical protein